MNASSSSRIEARHARSLLTAMPASPPADGHRAVRRFAVLMASVLVACGSSGSGDPAPVRPAQRTDGSEQLKAFSGPDACARVTQDVRNRIGAVLDERLDWSGYAAEVSLAWPTSPPPVSGPAPDSPPPPPVAGNAPEAQAYSGTTLRTEGVDEADWIKTDGQSLYHLKNTAGGPVLSLIRLDGNGAMALLDQWRGDRSAEPVDPLPTGPVSRHEQATGLYQLGADRVAVISTVGQYGVMPYPVASTMPFMPDVGCAGPGCPIPASSNEARVRIIEHVGTGFSVVRELRIDGRLLDSRRIGDRLHLVTQGRLTLPAGTQASLPVTGLGQKDAIAAARKQASVSNAQLLAETPLGTLLAPSSPGASGALPAAPTADDCASILSSDSPAMPGLIQIATVDLETGDVSRQTLLGQATAIYMSDRSLIVTAPGNNWWTETDLHQFRVGPDGRLAYHGSGRVSGSLLNDHAIDEAATGEIRIAARESGVTANAMGSAIWRQPFSRLLTLDPTAAPQRWPVLGQTGEIAPGETLQSARFVGNRAYLVTFLVVDPLFVFDLSDPARPRQLGELKIPGYSTYLHPVGEHHLLGLGIDPVPGIGSVVKASLFDITDPTAPREQSVLSLGDVATHSEAIWDRHAFSWYSPPTSLDTVAAGLPSGGTDGTLSLPVTRDDWSAGQRHSGLRVVSVRPAAGAAALTLNGTVLMASTPTGGSYAIDSTLQARRGVFVGEHVYAIADGELRSARIRQPGEIAATLSIP